MKRISLLCAALAILSLETTRAEGGFIAGAGGGVGFGLGDISGNGGFADVELGYEWDEGDSVRTSLTLAMNYTQVDFGYLGPRGLVRTGSDDVFSLAPRLRVVFPIDQTVGFYVQGQAGVNFSDALSDMNWGAGAGLDFRFTQLVSARLGYLVIGDNDGNGYHGVLGAVTFKF